MYYRINDERKLINDEGKLINDNNDNDNNYYS